MTRADSSLAPGENIQQDGAECPDDQLDSYIIKHILSKISQFVSHLQGPVPLNLLRVTSIFLDRPEGLAGFSHHADLAPRVQDVQASYCSNTMVRRSQRFSLTCWSTLSSTTMEKSTSTSSDAQWSKIQVPSWYHIHTAMEMMKHISIIYWPSRICSSTLFQCLQFQEKCSCLEGLQYPQ